VLFQAWEGRAYDYCMENLKNMGFPVDGLAFDPDLVVLSCKLKAFGNPYYPFLGDLIFAFLYKLFR